MNKIDFDPAQLTFVKSSHSDGERACVEVARIPGGLGVAVRDSKDPDVRPQIYTAQEWAAFVAGVRAGEFDL
ncbi:conserved hypothetical protein [Frankia canadensis]|uniref:DUF397 domain-containing protein n=1 Tax=Frankia canadensis TaxID=1836972 RepID=A0A2I2KLA7_9ACTN|nr:DUF397 domain-containing protein [Frankia canadensis]SNQ46458.1 conserved hypothetical protein [Frankia canadensis]SOU53748.1 conserved hypothetical protein [Frankia canadensis]